ncbi:MAG: lipoyl synthase [bacterium]
MTAERYSLRMTKKKITVEKVQQIKAILGEMNINTVCESAKCPNIGECFSKPSVTFMILGDVCRGNCAFCAVKKGNPKNVDFDEPKKIARATRMMGLKHTIITSVCRDDLADCGALHFAHTIFEVIREAPDSTIEVLAPDFNASRKAIKTVLDSNPNIFNHNLETVPRLYSKVKSKANYEKSLKVLKTVKKIKPGVITKSGLMIGLGETEDEVISVMKDLIAAKCDILTIGQYVQSTPHNIPVNTFVTPDKFFKLREYGMQIGFMHVESAPFVRSSYNADLFPANNLNNKNMEKTKNGTIPSYKETASLRI